MVSLLREDVLASYTLRTFSLRYMPPVASTASTANGGTLLKKDHLAAAEAKALVGERTVYQVQLQDFHFKVIFGDQ